MGKKLFSRRAKSVSTPPSPELEQILCNLSASEEKTRANAVRQLCPCRGVQWDTPVMEQVLALRADPSPLVRQAVEHDLEENPNWNKRSEARKLEGRRQKHEVVEAKGEIEEGFWGSDVPPPHSMAWRTPPRRRSHGRHRLSK